MLRNLAAALVLTEDRYDETEENAPAVAGRMITTLEKAKEVRPLLEKCVTIAKRGLAAEQAARPFGTSAERNSDPWRAWRQSESWERWVAAMAPAVAARRRLRTLLGNKRAVRVLFDVIAPRFAGRSGGYTRIVRLAKPRLGDAGTQALLEFVGRRGRTAAAAPAPKFEPAEEAPPASAASAES
jgi:large subunit ribosomal protein L17